MGIEYDVRYAVSPAETKAMDTQALRQNFLIENLFQADKLHLTYSHYDRYIAGGVMPVNQAVALETIDPLKSEYFLERREMGIINIGGAGTVEADGTTYELQHKEALYLGKGVKNVTFLSQETDRPAKFYLNSAPAHQAFPTKKVSRREAEVVKLGTMETANKRTINKLLIAGVIQTCQLQMGMTELESGSVWNTMPAHTHDRRMEVYVYFDIPEGQSVCHFMGQPQETRHIWMQNDQAVISPPWSIHSGAGTSNYTFIWGMAGENLDYGDMDACLITDLR
ncbi:5-dehydro-4-deoxy-D-glucuronate isomerase [Rufibacter latericius]|uniref:4-deoxy-L-threo-5-hexosulose-uronate ketol-isomerase n=1 Tax=Rufibacter latericius TaxID=2487040 RepID=A0A3M9N0U2_9BACT|nr:5-dehydro-4-deoxy-D-glucuronate isomerase [Rufibacter latericius]RNI31411.1 5-dehydro-4-deoxy-D-glucuronate isomerase [Rufibacter latericius]